MYVYIIEAPHRFFLRSENMMYTYKRNRRFPLKGKGNVSHAPKSRALYIRAALYLGISLMLVLSFLFISDAADSVNNADTLAYSAAVRPEDASGSDDTPEDSIDIPKFILSQEMPVIYGVNVEKTNVVEPIDGLKNTEIDFNIATDEIKMEIIKYAQEPKDFDVSAQGPQILIYHTHYEEAYRQIPGAEYVEAGNFYTRDQTNSVVAVGEALKAALESYGYSVLHDETDHMIEGLNTAYSKSLTTMEKYANQYPTLRVYIDVHRDSGENQKDYVTINGDDCARVMFVVGKGEGYTGTGFDGKPYFESNYKLALAITNELEKIKEGFTRPIRVKPGRYNQQVSDMCLLIEFGHNANSLQQAVNSAKYMAEAISRVIDVNGQ
jgi:stage II sporulation protein P